jgi:glutathione S-transferase
MKLVGMLDSPYVRRVAISLECLGVPFEHEPVSVFSTFERFRSINPVVKAPTLVCDDGEVLMDSSLILQFVEASLTGGRTLWPGTASELQHDFRAVGLALAACEKSVSIVYERNLRPAAIQFAPWLERVSGQMLAAYAALEDEVSRRAEVFEEGYRQAVITSAVCWQFTQSTLGGIVAAEKHPALAALSARMERTAAFAKYPPQGPGVKPPE